MGSETLCWSFKVWWLLPVKFCHRPRTYSTLSLLPGHVFDYELICAATVTVPIYLMYKPGAGPVWAFLWNVDLLSFVFHGWVMPKSHLEGGCCVCCTNLICSKCYVMVYVASFELHPNPGLVCSRFIRKSYAVLNSLGWMLVHPKRQNMSCIISIISTWFSK